MTLIFYKFLQYSSQTESTMQCLHYLKRDSKGLIRQFHSVEPDFHVLRKHYWHSVQSVMLNRGTEILQGHSANVRWLSSNKEHDPSISFNTVVLLVLNTPKQVFNDKVQ